MFTGIGSIEVAYNDNLGFDNLTWFQPTQQEMRWYMWISGMSIAFLVFFYYCIPWTKRFAQRRLQSWPELSVPLVFYVIGVCFAAMVTSLALRSTTFFGPLLINLAIWGAPAGCVFSFMLWNRNRTNVAWLLIFLGVFGVSIMYAMLISGGRRPMLSMFLGPVLCVYGTQAKYWSRPKLILVIGLAAVFVFGVGVVYSKFRWFNYSAGGDKSRSAKAIVQQMKNVHNQGNIFSAFQKGGIGYISQCNAHYAMLTKRYVSTGVMEPAPLNSLRFLISYPIPRKIWPNKPQPLGITVVRASHIPGTKWGVGFAGQAVYEGDLPVMALYCFLIVLLIRFLDEPLRLQPDNPFLLYMHATVLPNIAGIPRGDMGSFVKETLQGVLFALILGYTSRLIFGVKRRSVPATTPAQQPAISYPVASRVRVTR